MIAQLPSARGTWYAHVKKRFASFLMNSAFSIRKFFVQTDKDVEKALIQAGYHGVCETKFGQEQRELIRHYMNRRKGYAMFVSSHGGKSVNTMKLMFGKRPTDDGLTFFIESARDESVGYLFMRELDPSERPLSWWWALLPVLLLMWIHF